ncbi:hypothetical protein [Streptomyces sp. cg35]|uniref:hypothetical protein n=1 Tax=Streptomyces sp. cg35 TaxID=3421650 RepID=UPI003D16D485
MSVKNPNAAQVSKVLGAKAKGWKVTRESGQHIDYNLNQSIGARFPVALVTFTLTASSETVAEAVRTLTAAGYHAQQILGPTPGGGTRARVVVRSQEDLDDQAAREQRAANADAEAEKLVPATARVRVRITTFPDHARRTGTEDRAAVLTLVAASLREHHTDVMDAHGIGRECMADWDLFPHQDRMAGLSTRVQGKHATVLLIPVDDSGPAAPATPAPALSADEPPARDAVGGTVLPAGHTLGIPARHADSREAADAAAALLVAGHRAAELANETDDDDVDQAHGTGFKIEVREDGRVLVYHLVAGVDAWHSLADADRRAVLRTYRDTLHAAGWEVDGRVFRAVHAWRAAPLPEGVTVEQTRGERLAEITAPAAAQEPQRFTVKKVSGTARGVWDRTGDRWVRIGLQEACQEAADGLNGGALELDALGRIKPLQDSDDGPYEVYMRPDVGYAPDARPATLARAQQIAEDGATVLGWNVKGLGYVWELGDRDARHGTAAWKLRDVYEWAKPTGISVEGPLREDDDEHTMPRLTGHRVVVERPEKGSHRVVALFEERTGARLYASDTWSPPAVGSLAGDAIRLRRGHLKEAAALAALDDATAYVMYETDEEPVQAATAEQVRERLRRARAEAGPELRNGHSSPRMTLEHSGTSWITTLHAYTRNGSRSLRNQRSIVVRPAVVDRAASMIQEATGDGVIWPVAKPGVEVFGPWVRDVPGHADRVIVSRVACGSHQRPAHEPAAENWDGHMGAYRDVLEGAGWVLREETADGWIFQEPSDQQ